MLAPLVQCKESDNMSAGLRFNTTNEFDLTVVVKGTGVSGTYKITK